MTVALRRAVAGDAPSLAVLAERTFREAFGARNSPEDMDMHCEKYFGPDIQAREIADPGIVTTLALGGGQIAGFTQMMPAKAHTQVAAKRPAELNRIYVATDWQGKGVGRELMNDAIAGARAYGADCLWLGVWEHNPGAMDFYRRFGFAIVASQPFMLGRERQRNLIMALQLA